MSFGDRVREFGNSVKESLGFGGGSNSSSSSNSGNSSSGGGSAPTSTIRPVVRPTSSSGSAPTSTIRPVARNSDDSTQYNGTGNASNDSTGRNSYTVSEVAAMGKWDDKNGDGYSDYYTKYPSSTLTPTEARTQKVASTALSVLAGPIVGLSAKLITNLQSRGIVPGWPEGQSPDASSAGYSGPQTDTDKNIEAILSSPSLSDEEKNQQVQDELANAVNKVDPTKVAEQYGVTVQAMADLMYGEVSPQKYLDDPSSLLGGKLADSVRTMDVQTGMMADATPIDETGRDYEAAQGTTALTNGVDAKQAVGYDAALSADQILANGQATAQQGTTSDESLIEADQLDLQGGSTGINADGTTNYVGQALNGAVTQGLGQIIDTTTVSGRLLAQAMGEGNYVDAKATMQGQLEMLSKQFVGSNGEPKIPTWAAGISRNVSRIAAFKGMTGSAATAAMAQAIMEASLPIAQQDSAFFQTTTLKNLDNRQQMAITKANVLSKMDITNLDARMTAAVSNSKAFLAMDLANLDNRQQTEVVNTQARVQSILEDSKSKNAARLFSADAENDFTKFYDELNSQIEMHSNEQLNAMERTNIGEANDASEFNLTARDLREQLYKELQYNIDLSNVRWRQTIETEDNANNLKAAQFDIENIVNANQEALNRLWDREDSFLDYTWKSSEGEQNRLVDMYAADRNYDTQNRKITSDNDAAKGAGIFELVKFGYKIGDGLEWW
jgi:hypothetical protein